MLSVQKLLHNKAEQEHKEENSRNYGALIQRHRLAVFTRTLVIFLALAGIGALVYIQLKNQIYTSYSVISSVEKKQYDGTVCLSYENGFLSYSNDGISYTDIKGNAIWNQAYGMQAPLVRVMGTRIAVADYNGHIVYNIDQTGSYVEIDTNLPIRELAVSESGIVAAVLEDSDTTWIYLYNSMGERIAYMRTTMARSGYPAALALSPDGRLLAVSYISIANGTAKSSVAFYNFSSVGQNYVDNFASGADYVDAVIPYLNFMDNDTSFAVADNRLIIYTGTQRPKSAADVLLDEEIQSVFYNETSIGLVFLDTTGEGKYRLDIYNTSGLVETSLYFDMDYKDIILWKDNIIIYNETQCILANTNGTERFQGGFEKQYLLFSPVRGNRYLAVSKDSIDLIEMK